MFIRLKTSPISPRQSVQIVESYRVGTKNRQKILRHVGVAFNDREKDELVRLAKVIMAELEENRQPKLPAIGFDGSSEPCEQPVAKGHNVDLYECRHTDEVIDGFGDIVRHLFSRMGFLEIFGVSDRGRGRTNALFGCVLTRLAQPCSKRSTSRWLRTQAGIGIPVDRLYRMMTALEKRISKVRDIVARGTLQLYEHKVTLMLYDVTTLYFESFTDDGFRQSGWSKENKIKETQVVLALATTRDGLPLWYEVFPGKKWEGHTLLESFDQFKEKMNPKETVIVADRAMFTAENLEKAEASGYSYVVGAKLKNQSKKLRESILKRQEYQAIPSIFGKKRSTDEEDTFLVNVFPQEKGRQLVVSWSKKRSLKDQKDRERLLERAKKLLGDQENVAGQALIKNSGTKRYLKIKDGKDAEYVLDEEKIAADARWDGFHGVITNIPIIQKAGLIESDKGTEKSFSIRDIFSFYHSLWRIEESFRLNKTDLRIRPIRHRLEKRIRAHIAICYITYAIARQIEYQVHLQQKANMSFDRIRTALKDVKSAILYDMESKKTYRLPKEMNSDAVKIYAALGQKRNHIPTEVASLRKYKNRILF